MKTPLARHVFVIAPKGRRLSPERAQIVPMVEFAIGDITLEDSDAIVNPTGGGLVDLAVQRAAGPGLGDALRAAIGARVPPALPPGKIVVTEGFALRTKHVLHCTPPTYAAEPSLARIQLAECHLEAIKAARKLGATSLSFPAIGTGAFRFPAQEAAVLATRVVIGELRLKPHPRLVRFVLYDPEMLDVYAEEARRQLNA